MTLAELREQARALIAKGRDLIDLAEREDREMTTEESQTYEKMDEDLDKLMARIERQEKQEARERDAAESAGEPSSREMETPEESAAEVAEDVNPRATEEYSVAYRDYLKRGRSARPEHLRLIEDTQETRALQADSDIYGGYVVVPEQFMTKLIQAVDNAVFMRQFATVIPVPNAASVGYPSLDTDPADPTWTAEILVGSEDSSTALGKRALHPHPLAQYIKISKKLLRVAAIDIEALVRARLSYKAGVVQENAFLNGSGANEPLGVFVASDNGISTGRDVNTDNEATVLKPDNLIECKYTLKPQYHANARWVVHRDFIKRVRKMKLSSGEYIWQPGLATDRPATILDLPYSMSEYAPNAFTSALYVAVLGDFSFYWIADAMNLAIQVVEELYAATNQNGYFARLECDGMPVLEEAFVRSKMGT